MTHWSEKYVGRDYIFNEYDCTHLVQEVLSKEFGYYIQLPTVRGRDDDENRNLIDKYKTVYGRLRDAESLPEDGDVLTMSIIRNQDYQHIGLVCKIGSSFYVLHNLRNKGVSLHKLSQLKPMGIEVTGVWELLENSK